MMNYRRNWMWLMVLVALCLNNAGAQILAGDALKKAVPSAYFFAGQSAQVQVRNSVAVKTAAGHLVLAGLVDTSGYSTAIQEKYQGFFITETKLTFGIVAATIDVALVCQTKRMISSSCDHNHILS